jgi:hypothetical protein
MYKTAKFGKVIMGFPFNVTRKKEYTNTFEPRADMLKKEVLCHAHFFLQGKLDDELLEAGSNNPLTGRTKKTWNNKQEKESLSGVTKDIQVKTELSGKGLFDVSTNCEESLFVDCLKDDAGKQGGDSNANHWERTGYQNLAYHCHVVEVHVMLCMSVY